MTCEDDEEELDGGERDYINDNLDELDELVERLETCPEKAVVVSQQMKEILTNIRRAVK